MLRTKVRLIAVLAGAVAALLLVSASASAAGKPVLYTVGAAETPTFNEVTFGVNINPNGAPTTYFYEYGPTTSYGTSTSTGELPEGTLSVNAPKTVRGFNPYSTTNFRVKATNKYGTTTSENLKAYTYHFASDHGVKFPEVYVSKGTFTIEVPGLNFTINCSEKGSGIIGNVGGIGDEYNMELYNCSAAAAPKCKITVPGTVHLNANFGNTETLMFVQMDEETCSMFSMQLKLKEAFKTKLTPEAVEVPMLLTGVSSFGLNEVKLTNTSGWKLAGPGAGTVITREY